jgi:hypothetical protein
MITVEQAYVSGFLLKCAQSDVDPDTLMQQYLSAVPTKPELQRKRYEELISAGKLGIGDIGAKSLTNLNPNKLQAMKTWARSNPEAGARISRFLQGPNPYNKTKVLGVQKHPVYAAAFPKAKKGFNVALKDFVTSNPELVRQVVQKYRQKQEPVK